jgi:hypothetical protein
MQHEGTNCTFTKIRAKFYVHSCLKEFSTLLFSSRHIYSQMYIRLVRLGIKDFTV